MLDKNNKEIAEGMFLQIIGCKVKNDNGIYVVNKQYEKGDYCLYKVNQNGEVAKTKYNIYFLDEKHDKDKQVTIISREELKQAAKEVKAYLNNRTAAETVYTFSVAENQTLQGLQAGQAIRFIKRIQLRGCMNSYSGTFIVTKIENDRFRLHLLGAKGDKIADNSNGFYQFTPIHLNFKVETMKQLFDENYIQILDRTESTKGEIKQEKQKIEVESEHTTHTAQPKTEKQQAEQPENINYEYTITQDEDTRDHSVIYIVKFATKLSKEEYIELNKKIKSIGGYYSKFKHGFLFKSEPSEVLCYLFGNCDINEQNNDNTIKQETKTAEQEAANKQKTIDKINKQIESAQQKINSLSGDYKCNTYKRMQEQAGREQKINGFKIDIEILEYLLDTISERSLTVLESALINGVFRDEIHAYYLRHEAFNKPNRVTSAREIKFPEIDREYPDSWWNKEVPTKQKRLAKAGIYNTTDLIKSVEQYKTIFESVHEHASPKQQKIKKMEREARINQKGDINFTPSEIAKRLVEYARINADSRVLEPSAGIGNIADEINRITQNIDVCEQRYDFAELLKLKGYNVIENDFLSYATNEKYDAIIMNPPFSDEQNHIKHAYSMLKSGGILVSITSPHWTFASDRNSKEFKSWVENENSYISDLASGTFEKTGVASKILVIEKSLEDEQISA